MPEGLLALFDKPSLAAKGVRAMKAAGHEVRAAMPAPFPEVMEAMQRPHSRLGLFTIGAALLGGGLGLLLTIATSLSWPLRVGGKPVVSLVAFLVIVFESAVLIGALMNFIGLAVTAYLARRDYPVPFDARASRDRVAVFIPGKPGEGVAA
ncbi:MAG: quinol:electron acceptor oxidoreductase subunit ActD, partial [Myxococcales bacterium]